MQGKKQTIEYAGVLFPSSGQEAARRATRKLNPTRKANERIVKVPLTAEQVQVLVDASLDGPERRIITLLLRTGMHPAVLARPKEYDLSMPRPGLLTWYRPKTRALCTWQVEERFAPMLSAVMEHDLGRSTRTYSNYVRRAAKRAGLGPVSALTLRHTSAILRLMAGESPQDVMKALQISSEVLWKHYGNLTGKDKRDLILEAARAAPKEDP